MQRNTTSSTLPAAHSARGARGCRVCRGACVPAPAAGPCPRWPRLPSALARAVAAVLLATAILLPPPVVADEPRPAVVDMERKYRQREDARAVLKRRLDRLRRTVNGLRLERERARKTVAVLGEGYALLRNQPLRAAFSTQDAIQREQDRIAAVERRLDWVESLLDEAAAGGRDADQG